MAKIGFYFEISDLTLVGKVNVNEQPRKWRLLVPDKSTTSTIACPLYLYVSQEYTHCQLAGL